MTLCRDCGLATVTGSYVRCKRCRDLRRYQRDATTYQEAYFSLNKDAAIQQRKIRELEEIINDKTAENAKREAKAREEAESKKKWPFWFKVYEQSWSCTQGFISEIKPIFEKHGIQFNYGKR